MPPRLVQPQGELQPRPLTSKEIVLDWERHSLTYNALQKVAYANFVIHGYEHDNNGALRSLYAYMCYKIDVARKLIIEHSYHNGGLNKDVLQAFNIFATKEMAWYGFRQPVDRAAPAPVCPLDRSHVCD
jgi:hypothetical protein